ncbi:PepSY domain-containing protein [Actinocorallia sp. B10E7]|uniref:PepSY domain-containing protein n=1 Tax=Actinocorallia sp. B10E7 TaxID=3153558 RepID=UPI00325CA49D
MQKRTLIVIAAAGLVALGGGTAVAMADDDTVGRVARTVTGGAPAKTSLTVEQAIAKAQETVKGTVESVELEDDGSAWELDLLAEDGSWREVEIDAGGEVTHEAEEKDDDAEDAAEAKAEADALKAAKVSASQAASAATGSVSGTVTSVELEDDGRDRPAWKVEVRDGEGVEHEVFVDAADGKVLSSRVAADDDKDDSGEKDDD